MDEFKNIKFDKKSHTYTLNGKQLKSTTGLIDTLEREVDWEELAKKSAVKQGTTVKLLRKQWDKKREEAAQKGSFVHNYIERRLKFNTELDNKFPEMIAFDKFWQSVKEKMSPVAVEMIVGDYDLGIGGTIDTLFYSINTNKHHIFDWKTNEKFGFNNSWKTFKEPFDDLEDCHLVKYSLQLSTYKVILKRNTDVSLGDNYIVWFDGLDYQVIKAIDFTDRVEEWILRLIM